jgi:hypothetical protein
VPDVFVSIGLTLDPIHLLVVVDVVVWVCVISLLVSPFVLVVFTVCLETVVDDVMTPKEL